LYQQLQQILLQALFYLCSGCVTPAFSAAAADAVLLLFLQLSLFLLLLVLQFCELFV
jgi:hypothetical protein